MIKKITLLKIFVYLEILFTLISLGYLFVYIVNRDLFMTMTMLIVTSIGIYASNELNARKRRKI